MCFPFSLALRHHADVSAGNKGTVLEAAVGYKIRGNFLVVRRAKHVPDLVRRDRLVTVFGHPSKVAVILDGRALDDKF